MLNTSPIKRVAAAESSSAILLTNGNIFLWGLQHHLQLNTYSSTPVSSDTFNIQVPSSSSATEYAVDLVAGRYHFIALTNKGTVYTWGSDDFGQ